MNPALALTSIATDMSTTFYVSLTGDTNVYRVSKNGTLGSNVGGLAIVPNRIGVDQANTILYYATSTVNQPIKRWNLTTNSAMSDLVAGIATYALLSKILVLSDGSIIAAYQGGGSGQDILVKNYSAAGAVLHTYSLGDAATDTRVAMAIDDPVSFWIWTKDVTAGVANGSSRFRNVVVSSGAVTTVGPNVQYESGLYQGTPTTIPARFGYSESCDFWIVRAGINPPTPTVTTTTQLLRRQRTAPHLSQEQGWIFYQRVQFDFQAGVGQVSGTYVDPTVMIQWSDDGGHTWSQEVLAHVGRIGQYKARAIIRRPHGRSRDRIYRVTVSDPVAWNLVGAMLEAEPGTRPF